MLNQNDNDFTSFETEKLRKEKAEVEAELDKALKKKEQLEHQIQKVQNRIDYVRKGERNKRTHRLCTKGGAVESLLPQTKEFSEVEFYSFMEHITSLPEVQSALKFAVINHDKGAGKHFG